MKPISRTKIVLAAIVLACFASFALGEPSETEKRGSIPIGTSKDGSGPSDGALQGGSIQPSIATSKTPQRDVQRCKELAGTLQEECLRDLKDETAPPKPRRPDVERVKPL